MGTDLKKSECIKALNALAEIGTTWVKKSGKFVLPGLVMIKTRLRKATPAGKREMFGKVVQVKAMKAKTVVKAFAVSALKKSSEVAVHGRLEAPAPGVGHSTAVERMAHP